jgi:uncharacterized protein (TIGR02300 family)
VAKPEWGTKRICQNCGSRFYDLQHDRIICPKCHTEFDPEAFLKTRRARTVAAVEKEVAPVAVAEADPELELEEPEAVEDEDAVAAEDGAEEEDEDLIEDASELGEDEDDMAEVIENVDDEEER